MATKRDNVRPLRSVARPKQARSEQSLRRLLDAAESLIEERGGLAEVAVADIAKRARSSVGGFYARFRDKDELLLALHERFEDDLEARFQALLARTGDFGGIPQVLQPCTRLLVEIYQQRHRLLVAFAARAADNPRLRSAAMSTRDKVLGNFTALLLRWRDDIRHPDPELAAELSVQLALALMDQTLSFGRLRAGGEVLPQGLIEEEIERAVCAYLGITPVSPTRPPGA